ncbi:gap junction beta-2 protein-like isoform 1-T2 [Discoglossus pictus]
MVVLHEVEAISCLLSGVSSLASRLGRAGLAVLFFIRFGILAVGARTVWLDEEKDFTCNSSIQLCSVSCFNEFSPISSFNLFTLQLVVLITHGLSVACYTKLDSQAKGGWLKTQFRSKKSQLKLHILWLLCRFLIEGLFIFTFYMVSGGFLRSEVTQCHTQLCESLVTCTDENSDIKNIFNICLCVTSATSGVICLGEILFALQNIHAYRKPSHNLLISQKQLPFMYVPPEYTEACYKA